MAPALPAGLAGDRDQPADRTNRSGPTLSFATAVVPGTAPTCRPSLGGPVGGFDKARPRRSDTASGLPPIRDDPSEPPRPGERHYAQAGPGGRRHRSMTSEQ